MTAYDKHLRDRGLNEYIRDGAINSEKWASSEVKVLFLLKETYGYQGCEIIELGKEAPRWLDANIKTYRKIVSLTAAIEAAVQRNSLLSKDEIKSVENNPALLRETLNGMAVINIKKHSGKSTSNDREIRDESRANASLLKTQISELAPVTIVAGGNVCWDSLIDDIGLFHGTPKPEKFGTAICSNTVLCRSNHPSAWFGGGFPVEVIHRAIFDALKRVGQDS
jgi:hypothetical protein